MSMHMAEETKARKRSDQTRLPISGFIDPPTKPKTNKYAVVCAFLASLTSILLGYDLGVMSGAIIYIQKDLQISDVQAEIIMGILNVYSLIGSAAAGRTSDWIGRRYTIVFAGSIFFAGALLMGFATNYAFLMVGRFVAGVGVGYALMIAPVYMAEVAPTSTRGFLTSFADLFINFGILIGYISNFAFSKLPTNIGWRFMLGAGAVPAVFLTLGVLAMPESPRWLVMQGRLGEAKRVLDRTSDSPEESESRLFDIKDTVGIPHDCDEEVVAVPKQHHGEGVWRDLLLRPSRPVCHILLCAASVHFFQQASGIDSVVYYSPKIFEKAGIKNDRNKLLATIAVGFTKTLVILIATFLIDKIGRRPLFLTSMGGMIISLLGLGTGLTVIGQKDHKVNWAVGLSIFTVLTYVSSFSIGMGPVTFAYTSEIFPLRLRAQGFSIVIAVNRVASGVITMTFLSLYKAVSIGGAFFVYAGIGGVGWVFLYTLCPETRGKTLEEIEGLFGGFFKWRWTTVKESNEKVEMEQYS